MNGARFVDNLKPINREKQEAVQRREALKAEARLRQKLAKSNRRNRRRATWDIGDGGGIGDGRDIEAGRATRALQDRFGDRGIEETRATAKARQREHEQRQNLVLLMNQLECERLLEDMSEEDVELLEAAAWKLVRNELHVKDWRAVLKNLKDRRELRHPPPKYERRRNPPVGW